jgi:hypothetical protein
MAVIVTRAGKGSPLTSSEVDANFINLDTYIDQRTNPLQLSSRVAMTEAASGSNGIQVLNNANANFGTGNFTLHWEGSLADWTPAASSTLMIKLAVTPAFQGFVLAVETTGRLRFFLRGTGEAILNNVLSTVAPSVSDGSSAQITSVITRESASAAGSLVFYVNGTQLGDAITITAAEATTISNSMPLNVSGGTASRTASNTTNAIIYNRALSAAEVLSLCVNGPALADIGASQVSSISGDAQNGTSTRAFSSFTGTATGFSGEIPFSHATQRIAGWPVAVSVGQKFRIKGSFSRSNFGTGVFVVGMSASSSDNTPVSSSLIFSNESSGDFDVILTATATGNFVVGFRVSATGASDTSTVDVTNVSVQRVGITGQWNAQDAQSNTGQVFDSSGNGNHALLPAAGATVIGRPLSAPRRIEWRNTWAATSELQYVGGVNQAILENRTGFIVHDIFNTGSSVDVNIGDGSSATRFASGVTLAAGPNRVTLATPFTDGTNRKLTITPTASFTGSLITSATYQLVRAS